MNQKSRESLIELLFLSLYLDDHLSLAEDEVLTSALDTLGWESTGHRDTHMLKSFSIARDAAGCPIKTEKFLFARADVIQAAGDEASAFTWLSRVLSADGLTHSEKRFLGQLETRFFPKV